MSTVGPVRLQSLLPNTSGTLQDLGVGVQQVAIAVIVASASSLEAIPEIS